MGFSILISAEVFKHEPQVWYLDATIGVLIGLIILAYGVKWVYSTGYLHWKKCKMLAPNPVIEAQAGDEWYFSFNRLGSLPLLKSLLLYLRRLLVDMVPRVRQTRNYERFEWRRGGLVGAEGQTDWQTFSPGGAFRLQCLYSNRSHIWAQEDAAAHFKCFQIWCTSNIFMSFNSRLFSNASCFN